MRLIKKEINNKDGEGKVVVCAMDGEDMWHVYNLISIGDTVTATTIRKVIKEGETSVSSQRVKLTLTIQVLAVDFDPDECSIRLQGRNVRENDFVKLGAHHTVELEPHRNFTIEKDRWDTIYLERLETACNPAKEAHLGAVVMQQGLAHVCLITGHMTMIRSKIEKSISKKRADGKIHREQVKKFFEMILQAMMREFDFNVVKSVIIASPGYVKDDFFKYMMSEANKRTSELKPILQNKEQFILVHSSSGYKHALDQVLSDPGIASKLADTQAAKEVKVLNKFFRMLNENSERAFYSYKHVLAAQERGAVESLLVTDSLFRSSSIKIRKQYVELVEACRESGAKVYIFSALHSSGEQLSQLSGVAAILRFPLPELDDLEMDDEEETEQVEKDAFSYQDIANLNLEAEDTHVDSAQGAGFAMEHHKKTHDEEDCEEIIDELFS
mmetsp:Transcript_19236/g.31578  ORF Transcript_19236/g.31578 Transcript_19236/m.31578 type:complete len:442 (+) Transcript_19236:37-1362(+)